MRQLPVTAAFAHALTSTRDNFRFAWHVSWPWLAVLLPVVVFSELYVFAKTGGRPEQIDAAGATAEFATLLVNALAMASIAVNWHRYVLRDQIPSGAQRLRLDDTVWRYFGNTLLILLIIFALGFVATFILALLGAALGTATYIVTSAALAVVGLVAFSVFYRLGIKLPAVALERRDFGLRDAWRATAGNGWQVLGLALLYFATALAAAIPVWLAGTAIGFLGGSLALGLVTAARLLASWVLAMLGVTLLTSLYGFFVEGRDF